MRIADIDKNMCFDGSIKDDELRFLDVLNKPFELCGIFFDDISEKFLRMPNSIAKSFNAEIEWLNTNTSGGKARFSAETKKLAIRVQSEGAAKMNNMSLSASSGFDLYIDGKYYYTFVPPYDYSGGYDISVEICAKGKREYEINFPLYNSVSGLQIGFDKTAVVEAPAPLAHNKPIIFYGSSITQGASASRAGNSYPSFLGRWLNANVCNLGFSGNALGEKKMAEYIAAQEMSAFVFDYDHNAPSLEHLKSTHEPFFKIVRAANTDLPIVILSRPEHCAFEKDSSEVFFRRDVIRKTFENAKSQGDRNVYYIDGQTLFILGDEDDTDICTLDHTHPNDIGFYRMAKNILPVLSKALKKEN